MDLKLYKKTGRYPYTQRDVEELDPVGTEHLTVKSRLEIMANKVLKFFLTDKGSDLFDPEYGTTSLHTTQVSPNYTDLFKLEVLQDISRCETYFRKREKRGERIARIVLMGIEYRDTVDSEKWGEELDVPLVEVILDVVTTKGNRASIQVSR